MRQLIMILLKLFILNQLSESFCPSSCSCPSGFKGPRCQKTSRSFNGDGWAWYPPLQMCESSHLSFEFLARKSDGQLVYNGPVGPPKPGGPVHSGTEQVLIQYKTNYNILHFTCASWCLFNCNTIRGKCVY